MGIMEGPVGGAREKSRIFQFSMANKARNFFPVISRIFTNFKKANKFSAKIAILEFLESG
jgi:hypothetical protein